ncbi:hypothetical protein HPB52_004446 [Rhipicephalus sanguineus]|uniref:Uncharacterized protein n=1 Tax=Rhipicephalus sanguineus TaxID=34632 RepID=A0A9D4PFP1_RHISA|nr:hypothetical protein HPB52_004446 [Rhipicephalus sanguineus]
MRACRKGPLTLKASRFQWPSLPQLLERAAIASRRGGDVDRHGKTAAEPPEGRVALVLPRALVFGSSSSYLAHSREKLWLGPRSFRGEFRSQLWDLTHTVR